MNDEVKVTIIGVPREERTELKRACLYAETSVSAEIRKRLPQITREIEGQALTYDELSALVLSLIGTLNMSLGGMTEQARAAYKELGPELRAFRHQISDKN